MSRFQFFWLQPQTLLGFQPCIVRRPRRGPTELNQIRAIVSEDGRTLNFTYRLPTTFLSANRTAVRLATSTFGAAVPRVTETIAAASRVQAHRTALEQVRANMASKVWKVPLMFQCERQFCRRDDWGQENHREGMEIATYRHDNVEFQSNNQYVWILHIELAGTQRPMTGPASPSTFGNYSQHA